MQVVRVGGTAIYGATFAALYQFWYRDFPMTKFHFFNDNKEWLQMDKVGHTLASYHEGLYAMDLFRWAGMPERKAVWYGGLTGSVLQLPIEILDGFSAQWGASWGDLIANSAGSFAAIGQELAWGEQRILMKFSFSQSSYAHQRPNVLGNGWHEEVIKDYNGQTYWLSFNASAFAKKQKKLPKWLSVSLGYGAEGMLGGTQNRWTDAQDNFIDRTEVPRFRQYFLSLDMDLTKIKTRSKALKVLLRAANFIKVPAPALQYNSKDGFKFHSLYF